MSVPEYSQEIHAGHYPEFDGGGEAWCSPTSTAMILGFWGRGPTPTDYAYVTAADPGHADPWVDYAARYTYDYNYNGAGNWPFNVAYAHTFGLEGAVTQLRSLAEAEQYIKAGIPLVASLSFGSGKLDGFPFKSTNGHLLTIVGFTAVGRRRLERSRRTHRRRRAAHLQPGAVREGLDGVHGRTRLPALRAGHDVFPPLRRGAGSARRARARGPL